MISHRDAINELEVLSIIDFLSYHHFYVEIFMIAIMYQHTITS